MPLVLKIPFFFVKIVLYEDNTIDEVRCDALMEHFSFKEESQFFHEVKRVLKPGGLFQFSVPDFEDAVKKWLDAKDDWKDFFRDDDEAIQQQHLVITPKRLVITPRRLDINPMPVTPIQLH